MVPFNDMRRRVAISRQELLQAFTDFLDGGIFIGGPAVEQFESNFAAYCNANHCVGVGNGTDALELALRGLRIAPGDEVITVANAGGYTTTACLAIGAIPVYVDVDLATCQMDLPCFDQAITSSTRCVVVTHLYGFMNDVSAVRERLHRRGRSDIAVLEDCAQAHGATLYGRKAGSLGDVAAFSFYPTKNLGALGDAGAVVCRDQELAARIRQLRQYGWNQKYCTVLPDGRNSRMDPIHAGFLSLGLAGIDASNQRRREICDLYSRNLPSNWRLVHDSGSRFVGHMAVLIAPDLPTRNKAIQVLRERQIGYDIHYPRLDCDQIGWLGRGRVVGELRFSRRLTDTILSVPSFPEMTEDELGQVADALRAFA
jgi:aminotransferase EvaB